MEALLAGLVGAIATVFLGFYIGGKANRRDHKNQIVRSYLESLVGDIVKLRALNSGIRMIWSDEINPPDFDDNPADAVTESPESVQATRIEFHSILSNMELNSCKAKIYIDEVFYQRVLAIIKTIREREWGAYRADKDYDDPQNLLHPVELIERSYGVLDVKLSEYQKELTQTLVHKFTPTPFGQDLRIPFTKLRNLICRNINCKKIL